MHPHTHAWLNRLRSSLEATRRAPAPAADPAAAAAERSILGAHFVTWLDGLATLDEARREFAATNPDADPHPALVVTTSPVGISALEEILDTANPIAREVRPRIVAVTEKEYRSWCMRHPDDGHLLHVNHWSWVKTRVPARRDAEFAAHPRHAGETYWLHRVGTTGAGRLDGRAAHLWKFTGRQAVLLAPFVVEGLVPPRRA